MPLPLEPDHADALAEIVRGHPQVLATGARTKPRLSEAGENVTPVSMRKIAGITEYDPGEFTFTALAGTPVREIIEALAKEGQYLPFDPVLADAGATLGGTVAAGLNGPGRLRYGGIRDFILAVQFIDGNGQSLRGGAKVVKNAAGFDFPKFLVGSLGRFGILVELTFKVFPRPVSWLTLCAPTTHADLTSRLASACRGRWEVDALEYNVHEGLLYARLGGPAEANSALAEEICNAWPRSFVVEEERAEVFWRETREFRWAEGREVLVKVPTSLSSLGVIATLPGACRMRISGGGSCLWISMARPDFQATREAIIRAGLTGLIIRGEGLPLFTREVVWSNVQQEVRKVFDSSGRFPAF